MAPRIPSSHAPELRAWNAKVCFGSKADAAALGGKLTLGHYAVSMRFFVPLIAFLALYGCSTSLKLTVEYQEGVGSFTVSAFEEGLFGPKAVSICPETIVAEELTEEGPSEVWRQSLSTEGCVPRHRWSFIPRGRDGKLLYAQRPQRPIGISIFAPAATYASSGWLKL